MVKAIFSFEDDDERDYDEIVASINNDDSISQSLEKVTPKGWEDVFDKAKPELDHISNMIEKEKAKGEIIIPLMPDMFRAFHMTPLDKVEVVIIGQDPYDGYFQKGIPRATGMSFSVRPEEEVPVSLKNIFKEIKNCIPGFVEPNNGDLTPWAKQGVLLLNASLTLKPKQANCHKGLWAGFIKKVVKAILEVNPNVIFLFWGREAERFMNEFVGDRANNLVSSHPSGRSAYQGFFGCKHFSRVNELLLKQNKPAINWQLPIL